MLVLGIETTCDETAIAVVENGKIIHSNIFRSQIETHKKFGGVYPELASRQHIDHLLPLIEKTLEIANIKKYELNLIAASYTPGLIGCIVMGLNCAKALSYSLNIPFIGVHHIEAHLYAAIMSDKTPVFPSLGIVLSGGHTLIAKIKSLGEYEILGSTVDDAIGEAFDKVARFLDLPYPGGPEIEKLATSGNPSAHPFKAGTVKNHPLHFSFSGLKTNVLYSIKGQNQDKNAPSNLSQQEKADIAASFQSAAFSDVIKKASIAAKQHHLKTIYLGGGVTNSQTFRKLFEEQSPNLSLVFPAKGLSLDNGAMIAGLGYHKYHAQGKSPYSLEPAPRTPL